MDHPDKLNPTYGVISDYSDKLLDKFIKYTPRVFQEIDFEKLDQEIDWEQHNCQIMGKTISLPRLTKFYSHPEGKTYKYTGTHNQGSNFKNSPTLNKIFQKVSNSYKVNVCLLNKYKNGNDYIGFHADDEKDSVQNSAIASISFGASRVMQFRKKKGKHPIEAEIMLNHGDMLIMQPGCQEEYNHAIPKRLRVTKPRINLTFRLFK